MSLLDINETMVDMLFQTYLDTYNWMPSELIAQNNTLKKLITDTGAITKAQADEIRNHVGTMCWAHEKYGFAAGLKIATRLYIEMTTGELGEVMEP